VITVNISMAVFIDTTLANLYRLAERPVPVTLGDNALSDTGTTTFTLSAGMENMLNVRDVVEFDNELVYITAKSEDAVPVHTCTRGYLGTTPSPHFTFGTGYLDPAFPRYRVQQSILAAFIRLNSLLPNIAGASLTRGPTSRPTSSRPCRSPSGLRTCRPSTPLRCWLLAGRSGGWSSTRATSGRSSKSSGPAV
jgi:hypothetical protein